jgi:hypothetical protein
MKLCVIGPCVGSTPCDMLSRSTNPTPWASWTACGDWDVAGQAVACFGRPWCQLDVECWIAIVSLDTVTWCVLWGIQIHIHIHIHIQVQIQKCRIPQHLTIRTCLCCVLCTHVLRDDRPLTTTQRCKASMTKQRSLTRAQSRSLSTCRSSQQQL